MSTKKQTKSGENRRQFLKKTGTAAAAVAALKVPVYGAGQAPSANVKGANEKIVIGYVGVGGRGFGAHVRQMRQNAEENNKFKEVSEEKVKTDLISHEKKP